MKNKICIKIKYKLVKNSKVMTAGKGRDKRVRQKTVSQIKKKSSIEIHKAWKP